MNLKEREIPSDLTNLYIKKLLYKKEPFILEDLHIILASTIAYSIPSQLDNMLRFKCYLNTTTSFCNDMQQIDLTTDIYQLMQRRRKQKPQIAMREEIASRMQPRMTCRNRINSTRVVFCFSFLFLRNCRQVVFGYVWSLFFSRLAFLWIQIHLHVQLPNELMITPWLRSARPLSCQNGIFFFFFF